MRSSRRPAPYRPAPTCDAPSTSSHLRTLLSPPLGWTPVPTRLGGRSVLYQRIHAVISRRASAKSWKRFGSRHTLPWGPEEPLDDPVLLAGIRGDELRALSIVPTGRPESPILVDQPVVTSHDRGRAGGPQCPEASQARLVKGALGLLGAPSMGELPARCTPDQSSRTARWAPIASVEHMREVGDPPDIALISLTDQAGGSTARCDRSLVHEPALEPESPVHGLQSDPLPFRNRSHAHKRR
jgi:hypothetical protein